MTNTKNTKRALLSSVLALFLCFAMLIGSTFAWFTDSVTSSGNKIMSGTLEVDLELLDKTSGEWKSIKEDETALFNYEKWEPGYTEVKMLKVENEGTLALKWKAKFVSSSELGILADVIDVYVRPYDVLTEAQAQDVKYPTTRDLEAEGYRKVGTVKDFVNTIETTTTGKLEAKQAAYLGIALKMQETANNDYQDKKLGAFDIMILAAQLDSEEDSYGKDYDANAEYPVINRVDTWDGTADTSWYNDTDTEFTLSTAEQFAGFAELVDAGNTFEGKTILLGGDLDLDAKDSNGGAICFEPIGSYRNDTPFKGTFDGQGNSIKNLSQNTWALDNGYYYGDLGLGLFGKVEDASIKNLVMDGANISGESGLCGTVAGAAYGDCTFENITVKNANVADYQYYAGGIVGWASGNHQYINCNIDESTKIAAQWGDFDNAIGGVIGGAGGSAEILLKDCTVACRIDAYNDVTSTYQWYAYRRAGMLIGNSGKTETIEGTTYAAAPQLTCENVTVIYGDWANYTYCEFAGTSWPYVRVQAGVSNSAYSNPRYGHPTDANGNEVIDDNHVHNDGEDHHILCEFDQLYGGGQGVYGKATHDGVNIVYNNK